MGSWIRLEIARRRLTGHVSVGLALGALGLVLLVAWIALAEILKISGFEAAAEAHPENPRLQSLHMMSDVIIGLSYLAISAALVYLVYGARNALPFHQVFLLFGLFIIACGGTHLMHVARFWTPAFWLSASVQGLTVAASVGTAFVLPSMVPRVRELLRSAKVSEERRLLLQESEEALRRAHDALEAHVGQLNDKKAELEGLNRELSVVARIDPLTHLGNRLRMHEDLEALSARAERYGHGCLAMLLCDIDRFKLYNDTYGHPKGDEVIEKVAGVISEGLRKGDSAYRYGGEEFLIVLPDQSLEGAGVAAERIRRNVEDLALPQKAAKTTPGVVTISVGLAAHSAEEEKPLEELLKETDEALYAAKDAGRNCVMVHATSASA